jgi:hypothetical protein
MTGKEGLWSALRARTVALLAAAAVALTACATEATTGTSTSSPASSSPAAAVLATSSSATFDNPSSEPIVQVVQGPQTRQRTSASPSPSTQQSRSFRRPSYREFR